MRVCGDGGSATPRDGEEEGATPTGLDGAAKAGVGDGSIGEGDPGLCCSASADDT